MKKNTHNTVLFFVLISISTIEEMQTDYLSVPRWKLSPLENKSECATQWVKDMTGITSMYVTKSNFVASQGSTVISSVSHGLKFQSTWSVKLKSFPSFD